MIVYIEGNIGSGKSTFVRLLLNELKKKGMNDYSYVQEPVDEWMNIKDNEGINILDKFYHDPKKWSFPFQMTTFITRVQKLSDIPKNKLAFVERSVFTDKNCFAKCLHESKHLNDIEWKLYCDWFDWLCNTFSVEPCAYIYLKSSPIVALKRIKKRSRNEETTISLSYLSRLHEKHEMWMTNEMKKRRVLTIDVNQDFEHNEQRLEEIIEQITYFINNLSQEARV